MEKLYKPEHFVFAEKQWVQPLVSVRKGEQKLGEGIELCKDFEEIRKSPSVFAILGILEDVGPRANEGRGGSDSGFFPALKKFLNMQSNQYIDEKKLLLAGYFDFRNALPENANLEELRKQTAKIDEEVAPLIRQIVEIGKIPIVIGGGHNNCFPIIKGVAEGLKKIHPDFEGAINCVNLDPHADFRPLEGRHSGNGFSYAVDQGLLKNYAMVALHESYNSRAMLEELEKRHFYFSTYEDIFLRRKWGFKQAVQTAYQKVSTSFFGVELDLDSIENIPSSAETPCGLTTRHARYYLWLVSQSYKCRYLHIAEAAPSLQPGSEEVVGKLIAYLMSDFIKIRDGF